MTKEAVHLFLKQSKTKLRDKISHLTTDLINIGSIPLEPVLVGAQDNWRLMSNEDVRSRVKVTEQYLSYITQYDADPSCTLAFLKFGEEMPDGPDKELANVFGPFIELWAKGALALNLKQLPVMEQERYFRPYFNYLADLEPLVYSSITLSIGENISLLRLGKKGIKAHLANAQNKLSDINSLENQKIPALKVELEELQAKVDIYERELLLLNRKRDLYSDLIHGSEKDLQLLYGREDIFSLIVLKEEMLKNEQLSMEKVEKDIHGTNTFLKEVLAQKERLVMAIKLHQSSVDNEKNGRYLLTQVERFQAQLQTEKTYRENFNKGDFTQKVRQHLIAMLLSYKNKQLSFLKHSATELKVSDKQLDVLINYCSNQFKMANFYEPKQMDKKLMPFVIWLQKECRYGYNLAFSCLSVNGGQLKSGEFYFREIEQIIDSDYLSDATTFLFIVIGAIYISNNATIEGLPCEIIHYLKEVTEDKKLDKSLTELLNNSVKTLNNFIEAPDQLGLSEFEIKVLSLMVLPPAPVASNVRFFHAPCRPPIRVQAETKTTDFNAHP